VTEDINELMRRQQARELAHMTLKKVSGTSEHQRTTYLVTSHKQRDDLPEGAWTRKMSDNVVCNLAKLGLQEPISLRMLPDRWWKVRVDGAEMGQVSEYGCCFVTLFMSSARLEKIGFEVVDGPFEYWANKEVSQATFSETPGKYWDATISNRPLLPVVHGADQFSGYDDGYSSEALLSALNSGKTITVHSGPYETENDAGYALDLRWEHPAD